MKKFFLLKIFVVFLFLISSAMSKQSNFFDKGLALFQKKEFDKSKVLFEKDIVFNPKNEKSYLYLAKIFDKNKNDEEQEVNLNNVLIINPTIIMQKNYSTNLFWFANLSVLKKMKLRKNLKN